MRPPQLPQSSSLIDICTGASLSYLINTPGPVRHSLSNNVNTVSSSGISLPIPNPLLIPKEIWRVVDAIMKKGIHTQGLFIINGVPKKVMQVY